MQIDTAELQSACEEKSLACNDLRGFWTGGPPARSEHITQATQVKRSRQQTDLVAAG
jgi:hypothetical protein